MDPATIAAIVSAAKSYFEKRSDDLWKSGVSSKLNEISRSLEIVISELQALKVWIIIIDGKISDVAPSIFKNQVEGNRIQIESLAIGVRNGTAPRSQKEALVAAHTAITQAFGALYDWNKFGFTYYYAVISGVLTQLYAGSVLGFTKGSMKEIRLGAIENYFEHALDAANGKSVEFARVQAENTANSINSDVNSCLNSWWLSNLNLGSPPSRDENGRTPGTNSEYIVTRITGSAQAGFNYERQKSDGPWKGPSTPWFPGLRHFDVGDNEVSLIDIKNMMEGKRNAYLSAIATRDVLAKHVAGINAFILFLTDSKHIEDKMQAS